MDVSYVTGESDDSETVGYQNQIDIPGYKLSEATGNEKQIASHEAALENSNTIHFESKGVIDHDFNKVKEKTEFDCKIDKPFEAEETNNGIYIIKVEKVKDEFETDLNNTLFDSKGTDSYEKEPLHTALYTFSPDSIHEYTEKDHEAYKTFMSTDTEQSSNYDCGTDLATGSQNSLTGMYGNVLSVMNGMSTTEDEQCETFQSGSINGQKDVRDEMLTMGDGEHSNNETHQMNVPTVWIETETEIIAFNHQTGVTDFPTDQIDSAQCDTHETEHSDNQAYTCEFCMEIFDHKDALIEHTKSHAYEGIHTCKHCDKQFFGLGRLKEHALSHRVTSFTCRLCNESFLSRHELTYHKRVHNVSRTRKIKRSLKVKKVSKRIVKRGRADSALKTKRAAKSQRKETQTGSLCQNNDVKTIERTKRPNKSIIEKPNQKETPEKKNTKGTVDNIRPMLKEKKPEQIHSCEFCGKICLNASRLKGHLIKHTGNKPHHCEICGKSYVRKIALTEHMSLHTGIKPYFCETCHKEFATKDAFKYHTWEHDGIRPYACETCGKSYIRRSHLNEHLRTHSGIKEYECNVCLKRFSVKKSLKIHQLTHSSENCHLCSVCGKQFNILDSLKRHELTHKKDKKEYVCKICEMSFRDASELKTHARVAAHTVESNDLCDKCGKGFSNKSRLKRHQKTCEGMRKFKCQHCEMVFSSSSLLGAHKIVHYDEPSHQCQYCGKNFKTAYNVKRHMAVHR